MRPPVRDGGIVSIGEWAVDRARGQAVDYVLAFTGGRPLASGRPTIERPDVEKLYEEYAEQSGFVLRATAPDDGPAARAADVRVFAVAGGEAVEIAQPEGL